MKRWIRFIAIIGLAMPLAWATEPTALEVRTAQERKDLEWALDIGARLFGEQRPGLVTLRDRFAGVEVDPTGKDTLQGRGREAASGLWTDFVLTNRAPVEWSGSVPRGEPGTLSQGSIDAILRRLNYFRAAAGLSPVKNDASLNARCQAACLYISANPQSEWRLSHVLDPSRPHYTKAAAEAALRSCIDRDSEGVDAVTDYMRDWSINSENVAVPHRQWLLLPQLQTVGIGAIPARDGYPASSCIYVMTSLGPVRSPVIWPAPGAFPYAITPERWSVYHDSIDLRGSKVTVNGAEISSRVFEAVGDGTILVFQPPYPFNGASVHSVQIEGPWTVEYIVDRFAPE